MRLEKELKITKTDIPGLLVIDLPVHGDARGWFKENWQNAKMVELGLPELNPVQNNVAFSAKRGVTRGYHAEPWDKYVSVASGKIFCAWIDLREGDSFGNTFSIEVDPSKAIFIPRGVANSYQALTDDVTYVYLVNDHWSPDAEYVMVNLADPEVRVKWPIDLSEAVISDKDKKYPMLKNITPIKPKNVAIIGAKGQLGTALRSVYPNAIALDYPEVDITSLDSLNKIDWKGVDTIINAAAYTNVDGAETPEGRMLCWNINAVGPRNLAEIANKHNLTLVHISSDYVFDGTRKNHAETENFAPLSVYGEAKAAGDIAVSLTKKHYIFRTSWLIGEGKNFVRTMLGFAEKGIEPKIVNDQFGRLTFTSELVRVIVYILETKAPYGTYNASNTGEIKSWSDITRDIFDLSGHEDLKVTGISTKEYFSNSKNPVAPRPTHSDFNLDKLHATGFESTDWSDELVKYINKELNKEKSK